MPTVDEEFLAAAKNFIDRQHKADKPFFVWFNSTRMHIFTHLKPESVGKTGKGLEADGMAEHDAMVGELLKQLDDLGIANDTIVLYTTDNGAEIAMWPDECPALPLAAEAVPYSSTHFLRGPRQRVTPAHHAR
jgi:arylsulfatase A-like enzyme